MSVLVFVSLKSKSQSKSKGLCWSVNWLVNCWLEGGGCLNFSGFFLHFLDFHKNCIWSRTREQNLNDLLSWNGPQCLIVSRFTCPNDLKQPLFWLFLMYSPLLDLSSSGWSDQKEENPILHFKKKGTLHQCHSSTLVWSYLLLDLSSTALIKKKVHTLWI